MGWLLSLPLYVLLLFFSAVSQLIPCLYAVRLGDWYTAQNFFYSSLMLGVFTTVLALIFVNRDYRSTYRSHLVIVVLSFLFLPFTFMIPVYFSLHNTSISQTYFEVLSAFSTTGMSSLIVPHYVSKAIHLWRGIIGWAGGLYILVAAMAILEPLNLAGFEIEKYKTSANIKKPLSKLARSESNERWLRYLKSIFPIYFFATFVIFFLQLANGISPFSALLLAMATLSTSGITETTSTLRLGFYTEFILVLGFVFALSHRFFIANKMKTIKTILIEDPEIRTARKILLIVTFVFAIVLLINLDISDIEDRFYTVITHIWAIFFSCFSFMITLGFVGSGWADVEQVLGLDESGFILLTLALLGGGIATTASGIKLLRIFVLYKHNAREFEKIIFPRSVASSGAYSRAFRKDGAYVAAVFLILFIVQFSFFFFILSVTKLPFLDSLVYAASALTNTGPLIQHFPSVVVDPPFLSDFQYVILSLAMICGRLEILALLLFVRPFLKK